jgi:hypothetical protein
MATRGVRTKILDKAEFMRRTKQGKSLLKRARARRKSRKNN